MWSAFLLFFQHSTFVPQGQTINQHYYIGTVWHPWENVRWNPPEKWNSGDWFFHCDNAPAHFALSVCEFMAKNNITDIPQHPYLPDLVLCDFSHFRKFKIVLKRRRFNDVTLIQAKSWDILANFQTIDFRKCFKQWHDYWDCHVVPRRLLWRWQHRLEGKCCCYGDVKSVQKLFGYTPLNFHFRLKMLQISIFWLRICKNITTVVQKLEYTSWVS
jgi:hypothetical protein